MIDEGRREAIQRLREQGVALREISRLLKLSRNTVRRVLRQPAPALAKRDSALDDELAALIDELFARCGGNVVRIQELLREEYQREVAYSTLTRWVRDAQLRQPKARAGHYTFAPGEEMQHDTSPMRPVVGDKPVSAQCAALVMAYSRRLYIEFFPTFTRFEAKCFLAAAFRFMHGTCPRCVIDNTSVLVVGGSGPEAEIAPEMLAFGQAYRVQFVPHRIGHADRKARVERPFDYIARNFLAGRTFCDWVDLNQQARHWCERTANQKPKRALGMSPEAASVMERPTLQALPPNPPPVYQTHYRVVDIEAYVALDTNRYSVPERLLGQRVTVLKYPATVQLFHRQAKVAEHPRLIGQRYGKSTQRGHHLPYQRQRLYQQTSPIEQQLRGHHAALDRYVQALKQHAPGRGLRRLRRLLELKRSYPPEAFYAAVAHALHYGLYDLGRLEQLILERVAGEFFQLPEDD
jgi:transposase